MRNGRPDFVHWKRSHGSLDRSLLKRHPQRQILLGSLESENPQVCKIMESWPIPNTKIECTSVWLQWSTRAELTNSRAEKAEFENKPRQSTSCTPFVCLFMCLFIYLFYLFVYLFILHFVHWKRSNGSLDRSLVQAILKGRYSWGVWNRKTRKFVKLWKHDRCPIRTMN